MSLSGYIQPDTIAYILHKVMDYPRANCYTIWSSNINTTNIFQFLAIFAKNFAILPQKPNVPHFPEVYQSFLCKLTLIQVKNNSHLLSSKNSHDGTQGPPLYKEWVSFSGFMVNDSECGTIERAYRWIFKKYTAISMIAIYQTESKHIKKLCKYIKWISPFVYCWFIMSMGLCKHFVHNATRVMQSVFTDPLSL